MQIPAEHQPRNLFKLAPGAVGVVYGDVGTSPLYTLKEVFNGAHAATVNAGNVLGTLRPHRPPPFPARVTAQERRSRGSPPAATGTGKMTGIIQRRPTLQAIPPPDRPPPVPYLVLCSPSAVGVSRRSAACRREASRAPACHPTVSPHPFDVKT
ncbi:KUP/HAK/KT family potassium transporter [Methylotetracoccus oryzae]|uniref:KUP/HAK/KT family potassium transporter n=1 Tax=Methylotetracoccus oryzae TaxID=1919059 RepID=UPI001F3025A6|nr:KUP/HAK/KT family potassium transporter [Methylotetracoccus oryzae]